MNRLPQRIPLAEPSLAETADDMAAIPPDVLADIFRRENSVGISLQSR